MKRFAIGLACAALLVAAAAAAAQEHIATLRPATPLAENGTPAPCQSR